MVLAQVIKSWGSNSLPTGARASWIKPHWRLPTCVKALGGLADIAFDKQGQMGLEEGECGGPAPSWRHFTPPAPNLSGQHLPCAAGLGQQPAVPPPIPSSCCLPATLTSCWHGELRQRESSQGSLVYGEKQKWSTCHLCKRPGPPQRREHAWGEAPQGGGGYLPRTPSLAGGERQEPWYPYHICFRCI